MARIRLLRAYYSTDSQTIRPRTTRCSISLRQPYGSANQVWGCRLGRQPQHRPQLPWRLVQPDRRLYFESLGQGRLVEHLAEQSLVFGVSGCLSECARLLPQSEYRRQQLRRSRILLGSAARPRKSFSVEAASTRGIHYLKAGFEYRRGGGPVYVSNTDNFFSTNPDGRIHSITRT